MRSMRARWVQISHLRERSILEMEKFQLGSPPSAKLWYEFNCTAKESTQGKVITNENPENGSALISFAVCRNAFFPLVT